MAFVLQHQSSILNIQLDLYRKKMIRNTTSIYDS